MTTVKSEPGSDEATPRMSNARSSSSFSAGVGQIAGRISAPPE
ncbi:MAG: hypothetical protein Q8N47_13595 [Bryobacterales bacterium]|nr:hypothetical protein [Bryobacterales bacterium]